MNIVTNVFPIRALLKSTPVKSAPRKSTPLKSQFRNIAPRKS